LGYLCLSALEETRLMATILTCYYRPTPGGLCKRLFRAIESLLSSGHEVHYLAVVAFPISHPHCHFHQFPWPEAKTHGMIFWFMLLASAFFRLQPCSFGRLPP